MSNGKRGRQRDISDVLQVINLKAPTVSLFDTVAKDAAGIIARGRGNKPTQLRRFYDELVMWETRVHQSLEPEDPQALLQNYLPFIRMMNAKAAYAQGRKLVDENFTKLLGACLNQVEDPDSLRNCRTFFEAFMGFYKAEKPAG